MQEDIFMSNEPKLDKNHCVDQLSPIHQKVQKEVERLSHINSQVATLMNEVKNSPVINSDVIYNFGLQLICLHKLHHNTYTNNNRFNSQVSLESHIQNKINEFMKLFHKLEQILNLSDSIEDEKKAQQIHLFVGKSMNIIDLSIAIYIIGNDLRYIEAIQQKQAEKNK